MLRSLTALLLLGSLPAGARGARVRQRTSRGTASKEAQSPEKRGLKAIAGLPVYNYALAHRYQIASVKDDAERIMDANESWVIMFKPETETETLHELCSSSSQILCSPAGSQGGVPFIMVRASERQLSTVLADQVGGKADFIEPDLDMHVIPEVPSKKSVRARFGLDSKTWGLKKIGASQRSTTGKGVHVYILDTGIRTSHSDFGGRAIPTIDVTLGSPYTVNVKECNGDPECAMDRQGHGTHCAGSAAGASYGVAPAAKLHAVKVLAASGSGANSWILAALNWVATKGERPAVASMSLGSKGTAVATEKAVNAAIAAGVTVVVAAGNSNDDACQYSPAFVRQAITVGATTIRDRRASFSNYGSCVDIYAPGENILSAGHTSNGASATQSGTSMACPHVAGAAALLLEGAAGKSPQSVRAEMFKAAKMDTLGDLMPGDTNMILYVGGGGAPTPTPPAPPSRGACPVYAENSAVNVNGDCMCRSGTVCFMGYYEGCQYSGSGWFGTRRSSSLFSPSCSDCRCYKRR